VTSWRDIEQRYLNASSKGMAMNKYSVSRTPNLAALLSVCLAAGVACNPANQAETAQGPGDGVATIQQAVVAAWVAGKFYAMGALVTFNGITYECRQAHTSQVGWEPPKVPNLWTRPTPTGLQPWTTQTHYIVNSAVTFNGSTYECLQEHYSQSDWTPPVTPNLWRCASLSCGGGKCTGLADGRLCDDGNACTLNDVCKSQKCGGTAKTCPAGNSCQVTTCNTTSGACGLAPKPAGSSCSDGNQCNGAETCNASGVCQAGTAPNCDDGSVCTVDSCIPATGCSHVPVAVGTSCADGDLCNGAETCNASGTCTAGAPVVCTNSSACMVGVCDATTGQCGQVPVMDGSPCSDGDNCTTDHCEAGACVSKPIVCTSTNACQLASCDQATGTCKTVQAKPGASCGIGLVCSAGGTCGPGKLIPRGIPSSPVFVTPIPGFPGPCDPGLVLGPRKDDAEGPAYESITFPTDPPPPPGSGCREDVKFCDSDEKVLATQPTNEDIGGVPPMLVTCPPLTGPTLENCNIDPNTVGATCTDDTQCASGEVCGVLCTDPSCNTAERKCGKVPAGCAGVQDGTPSCDARDFRICAAPDTLIDVGSGDADAQLPHQTEPAPSSKIADADKFVLPPFQPVKGVNIACLPGIPTVAPEQSTPWSTNLGSNSWGVFAEWFVENHSKVDFHVKEKGFVDGFIKGQGDEQLELGGGAGYRVGGKVFGDEITALSGQLNVSLGECSKNIGFDLKIFGESVAVLDTLDKGKQGFKNLVTTGQGLQTDPAKKDACDEGFRNRNKDASFLKKTMFVTRQAVNFYKDKGSTVDFCNKTNTELNLQPPNKLDCANEANPDVPNAWIDEYRRAADQYNKGKTAFNLGRDDTSVDLHIGLFQFNHPYDYRLVDQQIPIGIGPITLNIALEFFGSWHIFGFADVGAIYKGDFEELATEVLAGPFKSLMNDGAVPDIKIIGGPRIEPGADIGVLAFVGLGIPGVSIGIQGSVNILALNATIDARVAAARRKTTDTRSLTGTDYEGGTELVPRNSYDWHYAYSYGGKMTASMLNGEIDAALRIRVLFFKKTFSRRLARLKGFSADFFPVAKAGSIGTDDNPLTAEEAYGSLGDAFAFSDIAPLTSTDIIANPDPSAFYNEVMDRQRECVIIE
jgi:hypothetical protein